MSCIQLHHLKCSITDSSEQLFITEYISINRILGEQLFPSSINEAIIFMVKGALHQFYKMQNIQFVLQVNFKHFCLKHDLSNERHSSTFWEICLFTFFAER